jgi:hypothetical protein
MGIDCVGGGVVGGSGARERGIRHSGPVPSVIC